MPVAFARAAVAGASPRGCPGPVKPTEPRAVFACKARIPACAGIFRFTPLGYRASRRALHGWRARAVRWLFHPALPSCGARTSDTPADACCQARAYQPCFSGHDNGVALDPVGKERPRDWAVERQRRSEQQRIRHDPADVRPHDGRLRRVPLGEHLQLDLRGAARRKPPARLDQHASHRQIDDAHGMTRSDTPPDLVGPVCRHHTATKATVVDDGHGTIHVRVRALYRRALVRPVSP